MISTRPSLVSEGNLFLDIMTLVCLNLDWSKSYPAHAHPQYLVMCGAPHVNFTLHQESFNDDWLDLMEDMGPVHNRFLKPTQINVMNAGEKLRDRAGFEYALGFDSMTATVAFEKVHAGLHKFMTDSDYELICNYFKEDLDCFGYSCDYNSTALAEKAYEKLEKLEQARWLPESHKLPSQLILEHNLEHTMVVAQKRLEMAEKRMASILFLFTMLWQNHTLLSNYYLLSCIIVHRNMPKKSKQMLSRRLSS